MGWMDGWVMDGWDKMANIEAGGMGMENVSSGGGVDMEWDEWSFRWVKIGWMGRKK